MLRKIDNMVMATFMLILVTVVFFIPLIGGIVLVRHTEFDRKYPGLGFLFVLLHTALTSSLCADIMFYQ